MYYATTLLKVELMPFQIFVKAVSSLYKQPSESLKKT